MITLSDASDCKAKARSTSQENPRLDARSQKRAEILAFIENDNRTLEEIFTSIRNRIQSRHNAPLPEHEAALIAERLIRFTQLAVDNLRTELDEIAPKS